MGKSVMNETTGMLRWEVFKQRLEMRLCMGSFVHYKTLYMEGTVMQR